MRSDPSGTRIIFWTTAAVPTSYRSSQPGCSISESLVATSATSRLPPTRCVDEPDRALLPDREREHGVREDDRVLERQNRELRRELELVDVDLFFDQLAHGAILTRISTRSALAGFFASGSRIVRIPRSYVAFARSTSISAPSAIWRVKRP